MKIFKIGAIALGLIVLASCSKYEEGPGIALKSKLKRASGQWVLVSGTVYDDNQAINIKTQELFTNEDGTVRLRLTQANDDTVSFTGTWKFSADELQLEFDFGAASDQVMDIVRLHNKEMKLMDDSDPDDIETANYTHL